MSVENRRLRMMVAARLARGRTEPIRSVDTERWLVDLRDKPNKSVAELALIQYLQRGGTSIRRS